MSQMSKHLRVLTALIMALAILVCAVPASIFAESSETAEALEVVSSYPYTTTTKVKVNLRAGRSTRSTLVKKIPAKAEITVKAVKGSWAEVEYQSKYNGYVKTDYIVLKEVKKVKVTPTPTPTPTLSPEEDAGGYQVLQKGDKGAKVTALQEALIELGFLSGKADGTFGAATEKAVIAFQKANDYPETGIMDANIQAFLFSGNVKNAKGEKTTTKTLSPVDGVSMKKGNTGTQVTQLQSELIRLGYLKSKASGIYDADTISAVRAFQKKNGLTANGTADKATQDLLFSGTALDASATATPSPTPTPKPTATPSPTPEIPGQTLRSGDSGSDVKILQRRLKALKYYVGTIDGKMDKETVNALKKFQKAHGLTDDGVAGKETYAILFSDGALVKGTTPTPAATETPTPETTETAAASQTWPTLRKNDSGENVAQLQEALIQLGYLTGKADGNYGTGTVSAVKEFQKANGLTEDGTAGEETQKVLFSGKAKEKAKATATATPKATATPAPDNILKEGSKGSDVKALQTKLIELGYLSGKADGVYGSKTAAAVKAFQRASKLTADGVAGEKTISKLEGTTKTGTTTTTTTTTASTASTSTKISASSVQYASWYDTVKAVAKKYPYATVYDYSTGISWQIHIFSVGAHADYEPVTANDTAKMLKAFGGNTWNPKSVWVKFSNGSVYLGSTHSMPHDVQHNKDNNFEGHSCLHFPRTQAQVEAIGPYATKHQETEDAGWATTQKLK